MPDINTTNLAANDFVPGPYLKINVPFGGSGAVSGTKSVLLMGAKLSSAPALLDGYVYGPTVLGRVVSNEGDVITNFGNGSELHKMYQKFVKTNQTNPVYFLAVTESTGAAASGSITFTTSAAAFGFVTTYVADQFVQTAVSLGDTVSTIATNVAASVNSLLDCVATASPSTGTVTLTAKNKGPRGNSIRFASQVTGAGIATTSSAQQFAMFSGGTVEDVWTNALATIESFFFDYIVTGAEDTGGSGNLGLLCAQVTSDSQPVPGKRARVVSACTGNVATAGTFSQALDNPRVGVVWQNNSNYTPGQLAAHLAGCLTAGESNTVPTLNWDGLDTQSDTPWLLTAPFDGSAPARADLATALRTGLTPVAVGSNGSTYVVSVVTSYSKDPVSGNQDLRARDWAIQTVADYVGDALQNMWNTQFKGKLIGDDPPPGQKLPTSQIVTESIVLASTNKVLLRAANNGLLDDIATTMAATQAQRQSNPDTRFAVVIQIMPIAPAHQCYFLINATNFNS